MFELNFRDERLLPFEGAGAIGSWRIQLPTTVRQFDYQTISDVILHIGYTAREGGDVFKQAREKVLEDNLNKLAEVASTEGLASAFSLRHDFPNEWRRLRQGQKVSLDIGLERLPYFASLLKPAIKGAVWLVTSPPPELKEGETEVQWQEYTGIPGISIGTSSIQSGQSLPLTSHELSAAGAEKVEDLLFLVVYAVTTQS